jgi:transcriptional regulator with XRE-family HTH domain
MIRFSQRLQDVLASTGWPQNELARQAGVHPTNVSRWLRGKELPTRLALGKVIEILPEDLAPPLVAAWVYDALPPNAERMVGIVSKNPSSKVAEPPPDEWPSELNRATRRKFIDFSRLASKHPDVMEIVNVLHAAAMRAATSEKGGGE